MGTIRSTKIVAPFLAWIGICLTCLGRLQPEPTPGSSIYYQVFLRSFMDSNQDGIGDISGLIEHLPYIDSLGVQGIWLFLERQTGSEL